VRYSLPWSRCKGGADVVGRRVGGGDDLVAGLDFDGVVAAQAGDELLDRPVGAPLEPAGDGEGGEDDGEVGLDRVAVVVVDRPRADPTRRCGSSSRSAIAGVKRPLHTPRSGLPG